MNSIVWMERAQMLSVSQSVCAAGDAINNDEAAIYLAVQCSVPTLGALTLLAAQSHRQTE